MSKRARDSASYQSPRDVSPARNARKQPKLGEIAVDERPPVAGAGGSQPKRQGESAPNPPMDGFDAHASRGMGSARRPGRQPSPTRGWKNSRDFDRGQQIQAGSNHDNEKDHQHQHQHQHQHDESPRPRKLRPEETPRRGPTSSPAGKLNSSTRSPSYTTPLPLFAEQASRATSATAPLTEQNLRSLLRALKAEDSRLGTRTAAATATAVNKSEAEFGAASRAKFAPAVSTTAPGTTGSGRAGPALASAPPPPAGTTNYSPSMPKSKSPSKSPRKQDKEKKKSKYDSDTHPLNLPPDQLRAHLAQMARQEAESAGRMSLDRDTDTNLHDASVPNSGAAGASQPATPSREAPGAFPDPSGDDAAANGVNGHPEERSPTPPPHRVPPAPKVDPEACKAAGNKFFKAKDYDRAIQEYTKEPSNPTYLSNRAAAYISANKYSLALNDCLQASHLDPNNDKILHRLARVYTSLGRPQDALDTYAKIPNASATDTAAARKALQCIDMAQKQIDAEDGDGKMALWSIGEATKTLGAGTPTPRRWQILKAKANLKVGTANALGEVTGIAQSLMRDNPQDAVAIVLAGRALYLKDEKPRQGKSDYERAEDHFRQALALDPDNSEARNSLRTMKKLDRARTAANDMFKRGKYSDAVAAYTEAITIDPTNKVTNAKLLGNRAMARIKIKEYAEAIADCDQALKLDPSYMKARRTRAKATGESGDWEQAVKDLKSLAEENASDAELAKELRNAELELKKSKRKDYYKILGIDKDAGDKDIERAYKKKAAVLHPDKTQGDKKKEEEFKDCLEAKETLLDPQKRQMYDSGADLMEPGMGFPGGMGGFPGGFGGMGGGFPGGGFGGGGGVQIDPEMLFNMMNGGGAGGGGFRFSTGGGRSPFG
ncbi:DnaJ domain-containing protein [Cladophialophora carrionii]|uniref:DnaJ domain-containing protein n=1 Tax=Cladophialophora carrionii TaxID=86049 RepID=A0A1C1CZ61_9EURO|nr:DnaJ domain-containing protein [Cladophialophora carrionii]